LTLWIKGDGSYQPRGSLVLCTDSFSLQDIIKLMNVLMVRYGLECSLTFYHSKSNHKLYRIRILKIYYYEGPASNGCIAEVLLSLR